MMDVQLERPLPSPSELTAPFWAAAHERRLVRPVCDDCAHSFFTPQLICPHCLSEKWSFRTSTGRGTVYSSTIVHRSPSPALPAPYEIAIVDMDEGWQLLTNIVPAADRPTPIGSRVEVTWVEIDEEFTFPAFRAIDTED
ncbi:Zn-ribbon domain-containing OB-fold protein [Rhodococcus artemisiae]|uniref:OB-fold domain-containing protein n=1 Tax=Rhodococcus artemisiae TaxID=714159 RepID=A0ABU7L9A8_9NOCA|nr:OB-fold domain-containing protein [Rhodococcus artemisiae]MEE2058140.1 OB-fold domain-containing protein [Rhodococcus artemisiae]